MTCIQRRRNVDATSWRCIDVQATLYTRHVPAGLVLMLLERMVMSNVKLAVIWENNEDTQEDSQSQIAGYLRYGEAAWKKKEQD